MDRTLIMYIYIKKFKAENIHFKNFRDMFIKDLISLPSNVTNYNISIANKKRKKKSENVPESFHFQKHIPILPGYKQKKYKNCPHC